jgi:hypothetical protein
MVGFFWCIAMKRKQIKVTILLVGKDEKGEQIVFVDKANQMSATGFRVSCDIMYGYGAVMPTAQIRIYGLTLEKMTKLLRVRWNTMGAMMNRVKIEVGDEGDKLLNEFEGNITFAYPDFANAPDVCLVIESQAAEFERVKPAKPYEHKGEIDVADIFKEICDDMGYQLENNGVSIKVQNVTLNGSNLNKLKALEQAHKLDMYIENRLIAITPKGGSRNLKIPVITPTSGLIGYPTPDIRGVTFKCLYDPLLRFGGICKIKDSIVEVCNGEWRIYGMYKSLEANQPDGNWYCEIAATWRDSQDAAISK